MNVRIIGRFRERIHAVINLIDRRRLLHPARCDGGTMLIRRLCTVMAVSAAIVTAVFAQGRADSTTMREEIEDLRGQLDGFREMFVEAQNVIDALKKVKLTGYVQSQFQAAESAGAASYAGGSFPSATASRFSVRRGRIKAQYTNDLTLSTAVLQIDITQSGVGIKDAFVGIRDPWTKFVGVTAGVFDRPFGFEISYSSSSRENPERTRMFQVLFPGERDLGMKLEVLPSEFLFNGEWLSYFNLRAGFFNGTGPTANENDNRKDFIGRLGFELPFAEMNLAIDGGVSVYRGSARATTKKIYAIDAATKSFAVDSTSTNLGTNYGRNYIGVDLQVYYELPVLGGISVRAEAIQGSQPSTQTDNRVYATSNADLYRREVRGFYVNVVQNVGAQHQFIVRCDEFDPNTKVGGSDIGASSTARLTDQDVKFTTLGIGYIYHWDDNVKFVFYYDMVANESVSPTATGTLAAFKEDVKDNVFTLRTQFRF